VPSYGYDWQEFKRNFIAEDGRLVDYQNQDISHSEGQGYAMLLAALNKDMQMFDLVWHWTVFNLAKRNDSLMAWKWGKKSDNSWGIIDSNNASDGDILIAWSLLNASLVFQRQDLYDSYKKILKDINTKLIKKTGGKLLLLPAVYGFETDKSIKFNPSYFIFPALAAFAKYNNQDIFWENLYKDSLYFYSQTLAGAYNLPPDWAQFNLQTMKVEQIPKMQFSFDAIRAILYLAASGEKEELLKFKSAMELLYKNKFVPASIGRDKGGLSKVDADAGEYAVWALVAQAAGNTDAYMFFVSSANYKIKYSWRNYYSSVLYLLTQEYLK
jgi:endoglucanase